MLVPIISNHVQAGLARLMQQYQSKPRLIGFFTAFLQHVQKLENALYPLDQYRQLQYAYGAMLDGIGEIVGISRNGLSDAEYYIFLLGTIAENNSDTTTSVVLYVVGTLFQASTVFIQTPNSTPSPFTKPAVVGFSVGSAITQPSLFNVVEQIIKNTLGAGIKLSYIGQHNSAGAFATAGMQPWTQQGPPSFTPTAEAPWPYGFGDLNNPYVGGPAASLITQS